MGYSLLTRLLRAFRKQKKLTQAALAKKVNRTPSWVTRYERGNIRLDIIDFQEIVSALDMPIYNFAHYFEHYAEQDTKTKPSEQKLLFTEPFELTKNLTDTALSKTAIKVQQLMIEYIASQNVSLDMALHYSELRQVKKYIFQNFLKYIRIYTRVSQTELTKAIDRPQSFISKAERGERCLDFCEIRQICQLLNINMPDFMQAIDSCWKESVLIFYQKLDTITGRES